MTKAKTLANVHARNYIAAVFEKRLREEGFICPNDKLLCWYRIKENKILNSIIFYSSWSNLPLALTIGYGIHPLFIEPVFIQSVHFTNLPLDDERFIDQGIIENYPINAMRYTQYSPEIAVFAPARDGRGIYSFDQVLLPRMDSINSVEDAYAFHKKRRANMRQLWPKDPLALSMSFIDMALYTGDEEIFHVCKKEVAQNVVRCTNAAARYPNDKEIPVILSKWEQLASVFEQNNIAEYLDILSQREQKNIAWMKKHLGLDIR